MSDGIRNDVFDKNLSKVISDAIKMISAYSYYETLQTPQTI